MLKRFGSRPRRSILTCWRNKAAWNREWLTVKAAPAGVSLNCPFSVASRRIPLYNSAKRCFDEVLKQAVEAKDYEVTGIA